MRARKLFAIGGLAGVAVIGGVVQQASASGVPLHDHYIVVDGVRHQVGPQVCGVGPLDPQAVALHDAFHAFHSRVHRGEPGNNFDSPEFQGKVDRVVGQLC